MLAKIKSYARITGTAAALSIGLSGCLMVHSVKQELLYTPEYVNYSSKDGVLPIELTGNPIGPSDLAAQKLVDNLRIPRWINAQKLRLVAPADRGQGHRLVMVFNPTSIFTNGDSVCANSATNTAKSGPRVKIFAALCFGDQNITRATAEGDVSASLQDAQFIQLLNSLMDEVMPIKNSDHDTTDCTTSPCE
jgi:hypothetical protein